MPNVKKSLVIQAGKYKGKKLYLPSKSTTRPTKSIIKGSVFDTLQFEVVDKNFIEVFGGSGSMGLEALSRGAKRVFFIEKEPQVYKLLLKNATLLDTSKTEITLGDSFEAYLPLLQKLKAQKEQAFIYLDPPFEIRKGMEGIYDKVLALIEQTPKEVVLKIIIEHMSSLKMPKEIGAFRQTKSKKFGKTTLSYYEVV